FSYLLIKSSRETVKQKEELEILSKKLAKNNRKLKELDDAKNEFISITAHQLRTPPTVIKGYINMAQEDPNNKLDDETRDALDRALISNERLIDLIEDILSVSRIESGKMRYEMKEDQDIEGVLEEIYESFLLRAQDKGLELVLSNPKERLPKIFMDGKKIREVISNLVDNAIKYTREGKVEIVASERDGNIRIEVKDTGVGVPREEMPYLFKKFSRGKNPGRLGAEGTGLGIFVGKKIVEDHGGKIWIESEGANKGSTFIIELPVRAVEQEEKRIIEEERREKIKEARQEKEVEKFVEEI
ncbi:MAG: HAMP domain-containing sensor histidine kinase, partial [Candidatus Moranbacteria bacterium]|nr:HAMP domain-containing sensor histidine kinase [Candidatus Moranbacteria bacterium]